MRRFGSFASRMASRTRSGEAVLIPFSGLGGASAASCRFSFSFWSWLRSNALLVMLHLSEEDRVALHFGGLLSDPGKSLVRNRCHINRPTTHRRADPKPRVPVHHLSEENGQIHPVLNSQSVK